MIAQRISPLYPVELIIDKKQHFYKIGDDPTYHPGVTTALGMLNKPMLIPWAVKMCSENIKEALMEHWRTHGTEDHAKQHLTKEEIENICLEGKNIYKKKAQTAADIGTRAHKHIDDLIRGIEPQEIDEDIKPCIEAFLDWRGRQTLQIELGDTKIGSKVFGYGGSLDALAFTESGEAVLIDFKTSKGIWDEMAFQLAAYVQAFKETYGVEVKEAFILRIGKEKAEFEVKRVANLPSCLEGFLAALKLHKISKWQKFQEAV